MLIESQLACDFCTNNVLIGTGSLRCIERRALPLPAWHIDICVDNEALPPSLMVGHGEKICSVTLLNKRSDEMHMLLVFI